MQSHGCRCIDDAHSLADHGAVAISSLNDTASGLAVLVVANFYLGDTASVNSSIITLDPLTAAPVLLQA